MFSEKKIVREIREKLKYKQDSEIRTSFRLRRAMITGRRAARQSSMLAFLLHRNFSRTTLGLRLPQDMPPGQQGRNWVNTSCAAMAVLGLSLSFFSARQLVDDPKRRCLLYKK